jgi:Zn-finger nucleic acid-binding protein
MSGQTAPMACPACRAPLAMAERQGIEVDYCPGCRGVWLDRGELDKMIERSAAEPTVRFSQGAPAHDARRYRDDDRHYDHGKRRKSFLAELFD